MGKSDQIVMLDDDDANDSQPRARALLALPAGSALHYFTFQLN